MPDVRHIVSLYALLYETLQTMEASIINAFFFHYDRTSVMAYVRLSIINELSLNLRKDIFIDSGLSIEGTLT